MNNLERAAPQALSSWWRENRSWALPTSCLAVLLPMIALGSCVGTFLTFAFGTVRLGASLRKGVRERSRTAGLVLLAFLLVPAVVSAAKSDPVDAFADKLFATHTFSQVAVAPDGATVAWVESVHDKAGLPTGKSAVYVADPRKPESKRRISAVPGRDADEGRIAWAPDSHRLAFLSDAAKEGQAQVYLAEIGGKTRRITQLLGYLDAPRFSPDGRSLAFLFTANSPRIPGPTHPTAKDAGVVEEKIYEQRIAVIDPVAASPAVREVSPADLYVYEYDWTPDGKGFAAIAAHGSGDDNWWIARLYAIDAGSGGLREIWKPETQIAVPRVSPDGSTVAVISGLMSDQGSVGGEVFLVPLSGGPARNLTPGRAASVNWLQWLADGRLLWSEIVDGASAFARAEVAQGTVERVWSGDEVLVADDAELSLSLSRDGAVSAMVRHSFTRPPEVWAGPVGSWQPVTRVNEGRAPLWGRVENVQWTSDGQTVQGWLFHPREEVAGRTYPMVVWVHGGPSSVSLPKWPVQWTYARAMPLSAHGYFIFYPNPRGSYGKGEAFTRANVRDFGGGDLRDILAGVDEVVKTRPVDAGRLGIGGWSYGGFMTMWALTQTDRFKAAMAGAGIANWLSYYGQNRIDTWMLPFFGASVYDDPEVYDRVSPIRFIKKVKTPALVMVGDSDAEVPAPQSYEYWHALKSLGVPTQLVVFPGEGHAISQPKNRRELMRRMLAWFDLYLQGKP
jgi:dipeptidyl aminopeptidase/acylaminoacyl peptidase